MAHYKRDTWHKYFKKIKKNFKKNFKIQKNEELTRRTYFTVLVLH